MLECEWNPSDFPASLTMTPLFAGFKQKQQSQHRQQAQKQQ